MPRWLLNFVSLSNVHMASGHCRTTEDQVRFVLRSHAQALCELFSRTSCYKYGGLGNDSNRKLRNQFAYAANGTPIQTGRDCLLSRSTWHVRRVAG